jgi:hypothetical protein
MGWVVKATLQPLYPREKGTVPSVPQTGWSPGPVLTGAVYLAPLGFDFRTVQPVVSRYTDSVIHHIHFLPSALLNLILTIHDCNKFVNISALQRVGYEIVGSRGEVF